MFALLQSQRVATMKLRIKEVCKLRNTTQKELAEKLGVTETTLSRAANGNTSLPLLEEIAVALGVEVAELFAPQSDSIRCPKCGAVLELREKEWILARLTLVFRTGGKPLFYSFGKFGKSRKPGLPVSAIFLPFLFINAILFTFASQTSSDG